MPVVIETTRLTKFYGQYVGLRELDLGVFPGEVFGLLGPNGAGKTTTIRLLLDFIRPTHGSSRVYGLDSHEDSKEIRNRTGYLPGDFTAYPNLTADEIFDYYANLRSSSTGRNASAGRRELCDRFRLDPSRRFGELSRGNRQKVGLVQAYMGDPELVILDEPTSGLDPLLQIEFQRLVDERRQAGRTQFISSHLLPEVEAICDRVGIIREGRLVALETVAALRARSRAAIDLVVADGGAGSAAVAFGRIPSVTDVVVDGDRLSLHYTGDIDPIIKVAAGFTVSSFESSPPALDEVFMGYYNGDSAEVESPETGDA